MQTKGMHTIIRDKNTTADNFVFYTDRLLRLVISTLMSSWESTADQIYLKCAVDVLGDCEWRDF